MDWEGKNTVLNRFHNPLKLFRLFGKPQNLSSINGIGKCRMLFTLTVALTDLPDTKAAVILALPAFFAVILPELFTVATDGLLLE